MNMLMIHADNLNIHLTQAPAGIGIQPVVVAANEAPSPRFSKAHEGAVVIDHKTGLMWAAASSDSTMDFDDAKEYVDDLALAGFDDWRLPTLEEREGIRDLSRVDPALDVNFFTASKNGSWEWTSTPYAGSSGAAWAVLDFHGLSANVVHYGLCRVRAVRAARGGQ